MAIVLALVSSCDGAPWDRPSGPSPGGPLSAGVDDAGGGFYADRPPRIPIFTVTFGGYLLCLTEGHEPATITAVRARDDGASPFTAYLRTVTPAAVAASPPRERPDYAPHGAADGSPPAFDEPYVDKRWRISGDYSTSIALARIDLPCSKADVGVVNNRQVPKYPSTELMIALSADKGGAEVDGFVIDYTVDGKDYRRSVPWTMVVCDVAGRRHNCGPRPDQEN